MNAPATHPQPDKRLVSPILVGARSHNMVPATLTSAEGSAAGARHA